MYVTFTKTSPLTWRRFALLSVSRSINLTFYANAMWAIMSIKHIQTTQSLV